MSSRIDKSKELQTLSVCSDQKQEDLEELRELVKEAQVKLRMAAGLEEGDRHVDWQSLLDMVQIKAHEHQSNYKNLLTK